jgi:hypothetical protein
MAEGNNKITNILLGAAIVGLGYVIYQTYPNEITANAESIKDKVKGLFGKKKQPLSTSDATTTDATQQIDMSHPDDCSCHHCHNNDDVQEVDIFIQEQPWNSLPNQLGTDVIQHYDIEATQMNQQAINNITGNQPTRGKWQQ